MKHERVKFRVNIPAVGAPSKSDVRLLHCRAPGGMDSIERDLLLGRGSTKGIGRLRTCTSKEIGYRSTKKPDEHRAAVTLAEHACLVETFPHTVISPSSHVTN